MEKTTEVEIFQTSDLFVVAYLFLKGFAFSRPPYLKKTLIIYTFEKTPELEKTCQEFFNRTALVEPLSLLERYRTMKTQAWETKRRLSDRGQIGGGSDE
jgi:hypothetical protein